MSHNRIELHLSVEATPSTLVIFGMLGFVGSAIVTHMARELLRYTAHASPCLGTSDLHPGTY